MKCLTILSTVVVVCVVVISSVSQSQDKEADKPKDLTSNQMLMRDKLVSMNQVLEGLTLGKFAKVESGAKTLRHISRATTWHIVDQTPQYKRLSKNFQEQAADLERHAKEENVEAAMLDLVRMNITCAHCHEHMREEASRRK